MNAITSFIKRYPLGDLLDHCLVDISHWKPSGRLMVFAYLRLFSGRMACHCHCRQHEWGKDLFQPHRSLARRD